MNWPNKRSVFGLHHACHDRPISGLAVKQLRGSASFRAEPGVTDGCQFDGRAVLEMTRVSGPARSWQARDLAVLSVLSVPSKLPPSASRYRLSAMFGGPNALRIHPAFAPALEGVFSNVRAGR